MPRTESNEKQTMSSTANLRTKVCHMAKRVDFEGYGFNLYTEKMKPGQYIGKVDPSSPAEVAGLKEGDRIIEVNGVNITQQSHKQVVQRIKAISNEVRLLIVVNASKDVKTSSKVSDKRQSYHKNVRGDCGIQQDIDPTQQQISDANINNVNQILLGQQDEILFPSTTFYTTSSQIVTNTLPNSNSISNGGLDLPMTVAEMRAKLLSKKKYDPKNDIVDLRKKFEIIQKL